MSDIEESLEEQLARLKIQNQEKDRLLQENNLEIAHIVAQSPTLVTRGSDTQITPRGYSTRHPNRDPNFNPNQTYDSPRHERREKVEIPEFKGKLDPDEFLEWFIQVERVFELQEVAEEKKYKYVILKLRGYASTWWSNLEEGRISKGKVKIREWSKMKRKLEARFVPETYQRDTYLKFHNFRQESLSVAEYTRQFEEFLTKCNINESENQTMICFFEVLDVKLAEVVELYPYKNLMELSKLARKLENQWKNKAMEDTPRISYPRSEATSILATVKPTLSTSVGPSRGNTEVVSKEATTRIDLRTNKPIRCFKCQGLGHVAAECPNRRTMTIREVDEVEYTHKRETHSKTESKECLEGPDHGPILVVRRAMSIVKGEEPQRECLFHTRCTIQGKVATVIIDNGSCANVASSSVVAKLGLQTSPHPQRYIIQWLNLSKGIAINSRVLIALSIRKSYEDEIWFDVLPMDACQILLGRPWMYDRRIMYDGFINSYSFKKGGKSITLLPIHFNEIHTMKPTKEDQKGLFLTLKRAEYNPSLRELEGKGEYHKNSHVKPSTCPDIPTAVLSPNLLVFMPSKVENLVAKLPLVISINIPLKRKGLLIPSLFVHINKSHSLSELGTKFFQVPINWSKHNTINMGSDSIAISAHRSSTKLKAIFLKERGDDVHIPAPSEYNKSPTIEHLSH